MLACEPCDRRENTAVRTREPSIAAAAVLLACVGSTFGQTLKQIAAFDLPGSHERRGHLGATRATQVFITNEYDYLLPAERRGAVSKQSDCIVVDKKLCLQWLNPIEPSKLE